MVPRGGIDGIQVLHCVDGTDGRVGLGLSRKTGFIRLSELSKVAPGDQR